LILNAFRTVVAISRG